MLEVVRHGWVDGLRVLLRHGANPEFGSRGDGLEFTPLEMAQEFPEIVALLTSAGLPNYIRKTDPPLPQVESLEEQAVNRQGEILSETGLLFQTLVLKSADEQDT